MAKKLKDLRIKEVSMVDAGANQHAKIVFTKREGEGGEGVAKDAETFGETKARRDGGKVAEQMYDCCYALVDSVRSIIEDDEAKDKGQLISESVSQFTAAVKDIVDAWEAGKAAVVSKVEEVPTEALREAMEMAKARYEERLAKAGAQPGEGEAPAGGAGIRKGGANMVFDVEKMTAEERAAFEDLSKRYGTEEGAGAAGGEATGGNAPDGGAAAPASAPEPAPAAASAEVEKAMLESAVLKAQVEALQKQMEALNHEKMVGIAKKYEILGKQPEELAKTLEGLQKAGGTYYADMISTLDSTLAVVEQSGAFAEVGKSGNIGSGNDDPEAKIKAHAGELMKADAALSYYEAVDKAWELHPELREEYEKAHYGR